ncbi:hypothetical protein MMC25_004353 [Agyrium rufum]|nr:hypothetical protein [Agyrium rufum]
MTPKYRASCNACNQAKVKCSKNRPKCERCVKYGDDCVYSVSLRAGKRPAHRPSNPTSTPASRKPSPTMAQGPTMDLLTDWDLPNFDHPPAKNLLPINTDMSSIWPTDGCKISGLLSPMITQSCSSTMDPLSEDFFSMLPESQHMQLPLYTQDHSHHRHSQSLSTLSGPSSNCASPLSMPTSAPSSSFTPTCHCFRTVFLTLGTLQNLCDSPFTAFDVALAWNKEAMALCSMIFQCNCTSDITFVMMFTALMAKIVTVYRLCCKSWYLPVEQSPTSQSLRVTLGIFQMDKEDEERFKVEIVRTELKKVELLVARLKELEFPGKVDAEVSAYKAMVSYLAGKLQSTFEMLS